MALEEHQANHPMNHRARDYATIQAVVDEQRVARLLISGALAVSGWGVEAAAKLLMMTPKDMRKHMMVHGITPTAGDNQPLIPDKTLRKEHLRKEHHFAHEHWKALEESCAIIEETHDRANDGLVIIRGVTATMLQLVQNLERLVDDLNSRKTLAFKRQLSSRRDFEAIDARAVSAGIPSLAESS